MGMLHTCTQGSGTSHVCIHSWCRWFEWGVLNPQAEMDAHMRELYGAARAAHALFAESAGQLRLEQDVQRSAASAANVGGRPKPPPPAAPAAGLAARLAPGEHNLLLCRVPLLTMLHARLPLPADAGYSADQLQQCT